MQKLTRQLMENFYSNYGSTGRYLDRYPAPNSRTLDLILRHSTLDTPILDIGCGTGRYALELARRGYTVTGVDPNLDMLLCARGRALSEGLETQLSLLHGNIADFSDIGPFGTILCLFGVFSHIHSLHSRHVFLKAIGRLSAPDARIIFSVPNAYRRFFLHQAFWKLSGRFMPGELLQGLENGDIFYSREVGGKRTFSYYHPFTSAKIRTEIEMADYQVLAMKAESVLSESCITRHGPMQRLDALLSKMTPPALGYGIIVVASLNGERNVQQ